MRPLLRSATFFVSLLIAAGAHAAATPVTGTLTIQIATYTPFTIPGAGTVVVNGSNTGAPLTALELPPGMFDASNVVVSITDPLLSPVRQMQITVANDAGDFSGLGGSGSFGGPMALQGVTKICLGNHPCSASVANLNVPLTPAGSGGVSMVSGAVNLTVIGAPWTTGVASIGTITYMGGVSPLSATDEVHLVTPIFISTNIAPSAVIPAFAFLTLTGLAIPEPATFTMLASGIVALVAIGRRARR